MGGVEARLDRGAEDALFLAADGTVLEGPTSNVWWRSGRVLRTPSLDLGVLAGVTRTQVRALGEAAPLLLIGAITGRLATPAGQTFVDQLQGKFTALPIVVYGWANEVPKPGKLTGLTFEDLNAAAIVVLLALVMLLNAAAILLRNRFERNRQG